MQKADITKTIITIEYTYLDKEGKKKISRFPTSLQRWIQKSPEQQEKYVAQHTKNKIITYNVL